MKKIISFGLAALVLTLFLSSCKKDNPVIPSIEPPKSVSLSLIDVSCTEAFIKVTAADSVLPVSINVTKDDSTFLSFTLTSLDTIVTDTTLQPNTTYTYQTTAVINGEEEKSDTLQVQSLKITSNSFTWQTYTFGDPQGGSSELNDVAIIDENNIWAVGEINTQDSLIQPYNAVHWDGNRWEIKRIRYYGNCSAVEFPPLDAIFAFSDSDIILTNGSSIGFFDGNSVTLNCDVNPLLTGSINKIWGTSDNDLYVVGDNGNIVHFNGQSWEWIESGTTANLLDVWGTREPVSGELKILATAASSQNYKILSLTPTTTKDTLNWPASTPVLGIWLDGRKTYVAGADIWVNRYNQWQQKTYTGYYYSTIRGSKANNIYGISPDGIVHYNGEAWQLIKERPEGIVMKGGNCSTNLVTVVGFSTSGGIVGKAVILVGTKIE